MIHLADSWIFLWIEAVWSHTKLYFFWGCYRYPTQIIFRPEMKLLVDEYEIFLDASHFRIPLIWCNVCIPVQSSSKKDPRSFKFLVFLFKFAGFRWIFSGQVPSHAKRQEILWWIVGGGQGGRVAVTVRYQLHQQDQTRAFSLKPLPLHPFGTLKRRRQKGWWVETFFFLKYW